MNNEKSKHENLLYNYHKCAKVIGEGCQALEGALKEFNQPLLYANKWSHHLNNDRVGVLFYDMLQSRNRWISVPISVFDSGEFSEFVKRYCQLGNDSE